MKTFKSALFAASMVLCLGGASAFAGSAQVSEPAAVAATGQLMSAVPTVERACNLQAVDECIAAGGTPAACRLMICPKHEW
jgi:hypothetical protein